MTLENSALRGLFITATDTNVGKTYIAAALIRLLREQGLNPAPYKPVVSGSLEGKNGAAVWEDVEALWAAAGGTFSREEIAPQRFHAALAPPFAAERESRTINQEQILAGAWDLSRQADLLVVEGAGGLLSPVSQKWNNGDLAKALGLPLVIVARLGLGTLNHTLLTIEAAQARDIPVQGVILTEDQRRPEDLSTQENPRHLADRTTVPVLAVVSHTPGGFPQELRDVDWQKLLKL